MPPKLQDTLELVLAAQAVRQGRTSHRRGATTPRVSLALALGLSLLLCAWAGRLALLP
jgi:hypothetical protein